MKFNYCILDEGHVIKNGKTKLSKAIKQLAANFRVILSGTPIQVRTQTSLKATVSSPLFVCCLCRECFFFSSILQFILRTTSWSSGRCSTSSCPASWERSASLPPATENPSWPAAMPKALHESRRQVCEHRPLPLLSLGWVCWVFTNRNPLARPSRRAGDGGPASAGAPFPSQEDEGGRPAGSSSQNHSGLLLHPESSAGNHGSRLLWIELLILSSSLAAK